MISSVLYGCFEKFANFSIKTELSTKIAEIDPLVAQIATETANKYISKLASCDF